MTATGSCLFNSIDLSNNVDFAHNYSPFETFYPMKYFLFNYI